MLDGVRITGLGVIEDAVLDLPPGFIVLTGETGAGKTMVVAGLGLLFGGRGDPALVRPGAQRVIVEGRLQLDPDGDVARQVTDAGGDLDDDGCTLLVSRSVSAEGRSRAHVGGRAVPVALLGSLADDLVAVHGQSDQQRLLRPGRQRDALDRYAGDVLAAVLADYRLAYTRLGRVRSTLAELTALATQRAAEAAELRAALTDVEQLAPAPGEDVALAAEEEKLANAEALRAAADTAHDVLLGDPAQGTDGADAVALLGAARRALEAVRRHDPVLGAAADRLAEATYLLTDVAADLASYREALDADPAGLAAVQERRAALAKLVRSYGGRAVAALAAAAESRHTEDDAASEGEGGDPPGARSRARGVEGNGSTRADDTDSGDDALFARPGEAGPGEQGQRDSPLSAVLAWTREAALRVAELDGDGERVAELAAQEAELAAEVVGLAERLTALRTATAGRFADEVTAELGALAMPHARLTVDVRPLAEPGPFGADEVELRLAAHPGAPALPLHKGASGGELSRVMLAVEVVFAGADPVPTFVFDEVDAGVGGKAAVEVGRRLARLAARAQVIVVTHLPQVAAFADHHLVVTKADDGRVTRSGVVPLDQSGRVRELSRMLAGLEESEFGRAHAEELLAMAATDRAG